MYLTYDEYVKMGGSISREAYPRIEAKARAVLDKYTYSRVADEATVRESVKYCMYDLANAINADEMLGATTYGREISSMSNDGVSVSFVSGSASSGAKNGFVRYASIVRVWLSDEYTSDGVPLLYAGVSVR